MGLPWPTPPAKETGYVDPGIKYNTPQYYDGKIAEKGGAVIGHLENLLCLEKHAGLMIKMRYSAGEDIEMIGRYFNLPPHLVEQVMKNTLDRICYRKNGWRSGS